jgi:hypothetical protein
MRTRQCRLPFAAVARRAPHVAGWLGTLLALLSSSAAFEERYHASAGAPGRTNMPYLIGWMLGVPLIVLVILYLIFH